MTPRPHVNPQSFPTRIDRPLVAAVLAVALAAPALAAVPGPSQIDLPNGWAPEGITAGPGTTVFVGSLSACGIFRADVRTGEGSVIAGTAGTFGVGTEYEADANRLWVAGGPTGLVAGLRRLERRVVADVLVRTGRVPERPRRHR